MAVVCVGDGKLVIVFGEWRGVIDCFEGLLGSPRTDRMVAVMSSHRLFVHPLLSHPALSTNCIHHIFTSCFSAHQPKITYGLRLLLMLRKLQLDRNKERGLGRRLLLFLGSWIFLLLADKDTLVFIDLHALHSSAAVDLRFRSGIKISAPALVRSERIETFGCFGKVLTLAFVDFASAVAITNNIVW